MAALLQGELEGGRNSLYHGKDIELLYVHETPAFFYLICRPIQHMQRLLHIKLIDLNLKHLFCTKDSFSLLPYLLALFCVEFARAMQGYYHLTPALQ